ncbi:unnamed protein product [Peniophora sp. CBMAI 1063]|nr:unnamed protein product [Peniophora sp. CBMAI 1063]
MSLLELEDTGYVLHEAPARDMSSAHEKSETADSFASTLPAGLPRSFSSPQAPRNQRGSTTVLGKVPVVSARDTQLLSQATHEDLIIAKNAAYCIVYESTIAYEARVEQLQDDYKALLASIQPRPASSAPTRTSHRTLPVGSSFDLPADFVSQLPTGVVPWNYILRRTDFRLISRWTLDDHNNAEEEHIDSTSTHKLNRSNEPSDSDLGRAFEYEWGSTVGTDTIGKAGATARGVFATWDTIPNAWSDVTGVKMVDFLDTMYSHYPWLRLCDGHWKAKLIGFTRYRYWKRDYLKTSVKIEDGTTDERSMKRSRGTKDSDTPQAKRQKLGSKSSTPAPSLRESVSSTAPVSPSASTPSSLLPAIELPLFLSHSPAAVQSSSCAPPSVSTPSACTSTPPASTLSSAVSPKVPTLSPISLFLTQDTRSTSNRVQTTSPALPTSDETAPARKATPPPMQNPLNNVPKAPRFPTLKAQSRTRPQQASPQPSTDLPDETRASDTVAPSIPTASSLCESHDLAPAAPGPSVMPSTSADRKIVRPSNSKAPRNLWYRDLVTRDGQVKAKLCLTSGERDEQWDSLTTEEKKHWSGISKGAKSGAKLAADVPSVD